jgi:membrane protease YdiL (CAAX protease family)
MIEGPRPRLTTELGLMSSPGLARDAQFWVALAAGPLVWSALRLLGLLPPRDADLLVLAQLILLRPLVEEFVFRGAVQGWALGTSWGRCKVGPLTAANSVTAIAFAASHTLTQTPAWAAAVLLPGLVFGYFRERTGSLLAPFLLHAGYNAGFFLLGPSAGS